MRQYVYVLEANPVFNKGVRLPLLSEFLGYAEGDPGDKQDSERRAFKRLAQRLKGCFPCLPVMVLDGLYPNGPVMEQCRACKEVWALRSLQNNSVHRRRWRGRQQRFRWVNGIEYGYDNGRKTVPVHVVVCEESRQEVDRESGRIVDKHARHVWISSEPLRRDNVHERGNPGARCRRGIETGMQLEKRRGYYYEQAFSCTWNAMQGYHYLMRSAHLFNAIAQATRRPARQIRQLGLQAFPSLVRETCANPRLRPAWLEQLVATPFRLRLE